MKSVFTISALLISQICFSQQMHFVEVAVNQTLDCAFHTGTTELDHIGGWKVYPNPSSHYINIVSNHKIHSIQILDGSGKTLFVFDGPPRSSLQIDLKMLKPGIYFCVLSNAQGISHKKISIQ